jgi:sugar phosphate isomerase/epimerase
MPNTYDIRSSVTVSLVPEARGGPFVFWDDLGEACRKAAELGFDGIEIFPPSAEVLKSQNVGALLERHGLRLAAVGTGAGWVLRRLRLTDPDPAKREAAKQFVGSIIDAAGEWGAPAIVGSMQGRWGDGVDREAAFGLLAEALGGLAEHARRHGVLLIYEPLNRYETNLVNDVAGGVKLLQAVGNDNIKLLADLFHMNIEESDMARALRAAGHHVGHVHLADSNRRPAGCGHTDFAPIGEALRQIGYKGYVSAEAFPYPDPETAAQHTIRAFRQHFE